MNDFENKEKEPVFSKAVRAGKRTYFFDVKATKSDDYYLTITESKKSFNDDKPFFVKHKLFLYKEDFEKFMDGMNESIGFIQTNRPYVPREEMTETATKYSDVSFEDLGN